MSGTAASDRAGFRFRSGRLSLDLTATVVKRHVDPTDLLVEPGDLTRWFAAAGLGSTGQPSAAQLQKARDLREAVYVLARARIDTKPLPAPAVALVNRFARQADAVPQLNRKGRAAAIYAEVETGLSTVARDAIALLSSPDAARLKECALTPCAVLFVDASRAGHRLWCDTASCGNRARVRRHRARRVRAVAAGSRPERATAS
jgi:predicted RNA-binding Zn ribbon-like protein